MCIQRLCEVTSGLRNGKRISQSLLAIGVLSLLASASQVSAQVIVPTPQAGTEGNTADYAPLGTGGDTTFQQVYSATYVQNVLGLSIGDQITGLHFRLDNTETHSDVYGLTDYTIGIGTGNYSTFAEGNFSANRSGDFTTVRTGPLLVNLSQYPNGGNPNGLGPDIGFNGGTPSFTYQGGDLLVEISFSGSNGSLRYVDAQENSGYGKTIFGSYGSATSDGTGPYDEAIIMGFDVTPVPEPQWAAVAVGGLLVGFAVSRKVRAAKSAA